MRTRQEVPHGIAVTVESFDENAKLVRIVGDGPRREGIAQGDHHRRRRQDARARSARAARLRAEELLGRKVHLETFVRVTPGWFDDAARLADMGYADEAPAKQKRAGKRSR